MGDGLGEVFRGGFHMGRPPQHKQLGSRPKVEAASTGGALRASKSLTTEAHKASLNKLGADKSMISETHVPPSSGQLPAHNTKINEPLHQLSGKHQLLKLATRA
eukprot:1157284-Pelagomonas_calceolata.AAC.5